MYNLGEHCPALLYYQTPISHNTLTHLVLLMFWHSDWSVDMQPHSQQTAMHCVF